MKRFFLALFLLTSMSLFSQQADSAIVKKFATDFAAKELTITPTLKLVGQDKIPTLSFLDGSATFTDSDFYSRLLAVLNSAKTLKPGEVGIMEYVAPSANIIIFIDQTTVDNFKALQTIGSKSAFLKNLLDSAKPLDKVQK